MHDLCGQYRPHRRRDRKDRRENRDADLHAGRDREALVLPRPGRQPGRRDAIRFEGGLAMTKSILLGAALGGLTAFAWSMLSWETVGAQKKAMRGFENRDAVAAAIPANAPGDGTYMFPAAPPAGLS